jgi:hypothetical protein
MKNYHIIAPTEREKYEIINAIRAAGAVLTGVSGYGAAYYIQLDATDNQLQTLNKALEEM